MPGGFCFPSVPATLIRTSSDRALIVPASLRNHFFIFHTSSAAVLPLPSYSSRFFQILAPTLLNFSISWREISFFKLTVTAQWIKLRGPQDRDVSPPLPLSQIIKQDYPGLFKLQERLQPEPAAGVTAHRATLLLKVPQHKHSSTANHTFMSNTWHSAGREIWNRNMKLLEAE